MPVILPVKVIVSCYKPSRSILNVFELILKAYTRGVSNRTTIFQDWAHQSYICCLFYLLWTGVKISSEDVKGPISLPSQIICVSDPKMLDVFNIFEDRSYAVSPGGQVGNFDRKKCSKSLIQLKRKYSLIKNDKLQVLE